uniref:Uncharacterized protein n=1 Tax=Cacopsylla melanoneura TaxID=428564 RepID=A0A8D8X8D6_9HEMI
MSLILEIINFTIYLVDFTILPRHSSFISSLIFTTLLRQIYYPFNFPTYLFINFTHYLPRPPHSFNHKFTNITSLISPHYLENLINSIIDFTMSKLVDFTILLRQIYYLFNFSAYFSTILNITSSTSFIKSSVLQNISLVNFITILRKPHKLNRKFYHFKTR